MTAYNRYDLKISISLLPPLSSLLPPLSVNIALSPTSSEDGILRDGFGISTQEAWLQNTSVRRNVLFGSSYDYQRYQAVLHACDLVEDINVSPRSRGRVRIASVGSECGRIGRVLIGLSNYGYARELCNYITERNTYEMRYL